MLSCYDVSQIGGGKKVGKSFLVEEALWRPLYKGGHVCIKHITRVRLDMGLEMALKESLCF